MCGQRYDSDDNFCSDDKANLISISKVHNLNPNDKICPVCGDIYEYDDNFCSNHENVTSLVFVKDLDIYQNVKIMNFKSSPNETFTLQYPNSIQTVKELLSDENVAALKNLEISQKEYDDIIDFITETYQDNLVKLIEFNSVDFNSLTTLEKMILFSKSFVKTYYKSGGGDLGHYEFNEISIDDRLDTPKQITTILHELSHFLLAEILEQIVCYTFSSTKSDVIEAFVCYRLQNIFNNIVDEYCAHTVEGNYARFGYQDYGSYKSNLKKFLDFYSREELEIAEIIGNTFSRDVERIMNTFIDDELRSEILDEFTNIRENPNFDGVTLETNETLTWEGNFQDAIILLLTKNLESTDFEVMERYTNSFKENG